MIWLGVVMLALGGPSATSVPNPFPNKHICWVEGAHLNGGIVTVDFGQGWTVTRRHDGAIVDFIIDRYQTRELIDKDGLHHVRAVPAFLGDQITLTHQQAESSCSLSIIERAGVLGVKGEASTYSRLTGQVTSEEFIPADKIPPVE